MGIELGSIKTGSLISPNNIDPKFLEPLTPRIILDSEQLPDIAQPNDADPKPEEVSEVSTTQASMVGRPVVRQNFYSEQRSGR